MLYRFAQIILRLIMPTYFGLKVEGHENLPATGPAIVVCNHVNYLDPMAMGAALHRPLYFMAKEELFANPVFGWVLRNVGAFPVRRGQADRRALRHALKILARGDVLAMFPEGTRSVSGDLQELQRGAAMLALRSGACVVPMVILGAHEALSGGRWWPRRVPMQAKVGTPLYFEKPERVRRDEVAAASDRIHGAIAALYPRNGTL